MNVTSMTGKQSKGKGHADTNFGAAAKAKEIAIKCGKANIINATIGVLIDDDDNFGVFPTVEEIYRNLPAQELMDYAPISGLKDFNDAVVSFVFRDKHLPKGSKVASVATPGGSGAIHHSLYNYITTGDSYLIPELHWEPYHEMAVEMKNVAVPYSMFDNNLNFTLNDLKEKAARLLEKQDSLLTIFNTPAHNPTGYSMTNNDWQEIVDFYKTCAANGKNIIVVWDMAYTDYAGDADEVRDFLKYFDDMPDNMMLLVAFSMSKSFLIYGMRSGALVCVSTSDAVIDEFKLVNSFSNRATWSNGTRGAQKLLSVIMNNDKYQKLVDSERKQASDMMLGRAKIFLEEAADIGLKTYPYDAGFFITIPTDKCFELSDALQKQNIFTIPLGTGLRVAVSAVPTCKMKGLASSIKQCLDTLL